MPINNLPPVPTANAPWFNPDGTPTPVFLKFLTALMQALKSVP